MLTVLEIRQREKEPLELEERNLIMQLSPIYLKRLEEATQEGIEQGIEQGIERGIERGIEQGIEQGIERGIERGIEQERRANIESLMLLRFQTIDPQLQSIIPELVQMKASEFTPLILQLSKEELLARFS